MPKAKIPEPTPVIKDLPGDAEKLYQEGQKNSAPPSLKSQLFEAASAAFPTGEVSVKILTPDDPKLARRNFTDNQVYVRVRFEGYAVAGFIPETSKPDEMDKLIVRLKHDARTSAAALKPQPAI
jgi:hypothetical protein